MAGKPLPRLLFRPCQKQKDNSYGCQYAQASDTIAHLIWISPGYREDRQTDADDHLIQKPLSHPVPIPLLSVDIAEILMVDLKKGRSPIHILDRPFVIKYNESLFR